MIIHLRFVFFVSGYFGYFFLFFFFNDTATTEIYTLSLHDALPIFLADAAGCGNAFAEPDDPRERSEEHTSELQSRENLVCRLLLEKKKKTKKNDRKTKKKKKENYRSNPKKQK